MSSRTLCVNRLRAEQVGELRRQHPDHLTDLDLAAACTKALISFPITKYDTISDTLFVYDWLLTFKTERELVRSKSITNMHLTSLQLAGSGFTPVRLAYFFCRYWPLVMHPVTIWAQVCPSS